MEASFALGASCTQLRPNGFIVAGARLESMRIPPGAGIESGPVAVRRHGRNIAEIDQHDRVWEFAHVAVAVPQGFSLATKVRRTSRPVRLDSKVPAWTRFRAWPFTVEGGKAGGPCHFQVRYAVRGPDGVEHTAGPVGLQCSRRRYLLAMGLLREVASETGARPFLDCSRIHELLEVVAEQGPKRGAGVHRCFGALPSSRLSKEAARMPSRRQCQRTAASTRGKPSAFAMMRTSCMSVGWLNSAWGKPAR